ncbi:acetyl-CoA carboxylase biotin carboxyl carrier protein subunit [Pigmentiphaga sp. GD03639]|uniref:Biotin/lipoyl-binding carrier protein n=1 Tax=Pigmentiphaga daeguensis TaxID=414049 RepID=A0ABP3L6M1_9BURK|nr:MULTISPECIES: acetyl-CoA carboxylase biotin carboxyl carrier protein subunit [unclassified Pigmentiphaga]MDH2237731.1 acetyl-CoA carboxylase biotin carboxyl carrier protein subunit [Pigmentiphaga sp. GD03639]OVZ54090.1 acetyl-CoA carboxylase biotin carboxyl carrier protein subunit [Pigmentiphaga sp. NML080357]OVZ62261.1 acetyl-CoA carboxylase biotin carboxyl carrier protein subunit [Pigmentiphaga sp. NML030171]
MARIEVQSEITGTVWKVETSVGANVDAEAALLIVESMKMEIPVPAPVAGTVLELRVGEGDPVEEGQVVAVIEG